MSNEEKILAMLEKIDKDIQGLKSSGNIKSTSDKPKMSGREALLAMSKLLSDEEKDELGRYQAAEEARKAALYG